MFNILAFSNNVMVESTLWGDLTEEKKNSFGEKKKKKPKLNL